MSIPLCRKPKTEDPQTVERIRGSYVEEWLQSEIIFSRSETLEVILECLR
jgi:hypothetical protein